MNQYIDSALAFVKRHSFWVELSLYVLLAGGTALWIGKDAYRQAAALSQEGQRLDAMRRAADQWLGSLEPASSVETQEWQQTLEALNQMGASKDSRLTLIEVITRRAERAGLGGVRSTIVGAETLSAIPRTGASPISYTVADYGILVDFTGNLAATRVFLDNLPPAVAVQSIRMTRAGPTMGTHAVLTVYEAVADAPI